MILTLEHMNWLDILIIGLLFLGLLYGTKQGFVRQLSMLASILIAATCYGILAPTIGAYAVEYLHIAPKIMGIVGFLGAFAFIAFGVRFLGNVLSRIINKTPLGLLNRMGGAVVGVFMTALCIGLLALCIDFVSPIPKPSNPKTVIDDPSSTTPPRSIREESILYGSLKEMIPTILPLDLFRK